VFLTVLFRQYLHIEQARLLVHLHAQLVKALIIKMAMLVGHVLLQTAHFAVSHKQLEIKSVMDAPLIISGTETQLLL